MISLWPNDCALRDGSRDYRPGEIKVYFFRSRVENKPIPARSRDALPTVYFACERVEQTRKTIAMLCF